MTRRAMLLGASALSAVVLLVTAPALPSTAMGAFRGAVSQTLLVGLGAALLGGLLGGALAGLAALVGKRAEAAVTRLTEVAGALPTVLLVPIVTLGGGSSVALRLLLVIAVVRAAEAAHVLRIQVRALEREGYVLSAIALGASRWRVLTRHLAPHVAPPLLLTLAVGAASAVGLEVSVSFLGLSPGERGLGAYAADAFARGERAPLVLAAGAAALIAGTLLTLAEWLRDALDRRGRGALPGISG